MSTEHTVSVTTATRAQLGAFAGRITEWRTDRYLAAGFYDRAAVESFHLAGLPIETNEESDYEIVATSACGRILATLSLRQPHGAEHEVSGSSRRPSFALESVHGRGFLALLGDTPLERVWEAGRFLRDRELPTSQAAAAVAEAAARLAIRLAADNQACWIVGEVEPQVALRHLTALGLPVITGEEVTSPVVDGLLARRYVGRTVVPFAVRIDAIPAAVVAGWEGIPQRPHLLHGLSHGK